MAPKFTTVDDYLAALPEEQRLILEEVRRRLRAAMPAGEETISYQMPTVKLDGESVVHYAAWKKHLSLYPAPAVTDDPEFERAFADRRGEKGTATFAYTDPMPYELIQRMVEHLLAQRTIRR
ncbi:conserved hypothetical protein [metagenome]|uniref:YdhG-like domain-containing protein n=1 Tax=metagenome TaxID=256318 RepID=A0A2P2BZ20_9ZZZZ